MQNILVKFKFQNLLKFDHWTHPKIEKLLEEVSTFISRQAVSCNVTLKLVRECIVAVEKEYILHVLNARFSHLLVAYSHSWPAGF